MRDKERRATALTKDPTRRAEFIELLKIDNISMGEIASLLRTSTCHVTDSLRRLLWESAYQLANEDEIAKLWICVWTLTKKVADLEKRINIKPISK